MSVHSLHFGLNYPNSNMELAGCVNDAKDLAALCKPYVDSTAIVLNNKADRAGAHKAVKTLCEKLGKGDTGIITLSSHGTREKSGGRYVEAVVWADSELTYDYEMDDAFADRDTGSYLLILADCCHAGGLPSTRGGSGHKRWARITAGVRSISVNLCRTHAIEHRGIRRRRGGYYWLGCEPKQYCYDAYFDGRANGACSYYVCEARKKLKSGNTYHDWFKLIAGKRPKGYLPTADYDQQPVEAGSLALGKRKVPF